MQRESSDEKRGVAFRMAAAYCLCDHYPRGKRAQAETADGLGGVIE
jgi:hypothetical protein